MFVELEEAWLREVPIVCATIEDTLPFCRDAPPAKTSYTQDPELQCWWGNHPLQCKEAFEEMKAIVYEFCDVFAYSLKDSTGYTGDYPPFEIDVIGNEPIYEPPRYHSPAERAVIDEKCTELLEAGIIVPCPITVHASHPTCPMKKNAAGEWTERRYCLDLKALNARTRQHDRYAVPNIQQLFQDTDQCTFILAGDCKSGFAQTWIAESSRPYTAVWWNRHGTGISTVTYTRTPQGCMNASAYYQRLMDYELSKNGLTPFARSFIDDVLGQSDDQWDFNKQLRKFMEMMCKVGLKLHPAKTVFCAPVVEYLGHNISKYGMTPHEARVKAIMDMPSPQNVSELRSVLGLFNYYRCYVPGFSALAHNAQSADEKGC